MSDRDVMVACPCPGTPHDLDTVTLYERVPLRAGMACYAILQMTPDLRSEEMTGMWAEQLVRLGVQTWTLVDEKGKALPVTPGNTEMLSFGVQRAIGNAAMNRFGEELITPLPDRTSKRSETGPTDGSTSANHGSGGPRRAHSKRSLPNGSAGRPSVAQVP